MARVGVPAGGDAIAGRHGVCGCLRGRRRGPLVPVRQRRPGEAWARWRVPYQPVVVLVDKHGRIAERFDGGTTGGTLAAALAYLLGE